MATSRSSTGSSTAGRPKWWNVMAISEDGHVLAGHVCSSPVYFEHDLGFGSSDWQHDKYDAHYPDGWQLEWVERDDIAGHEGLQAAFALGNAMRETADDVQPR